MQKIILFVLLILIGGCSGCDTEEKKTPQAIQPIMQIPDIETEEGILIFIHSGDPNIDAAKIDLWWLDVKQCLQMEATPPVIRYANDTREVCKSATGAVGNHCNNGDGLGWFIAINSSWAHIIYQTKHEMIHYVREQNSDIAHREHDTNDALWQCQWN